MSDKNENTGCILPIVLGVIGGIVANGNKDGPMAVVGFVLGVLVGMIINWRIKNGPKY